MYKIDWSKYLSTERERPPQSQLDARRLANSVDMRNDFDSDFGRVIFCSAARRMHDKTQVFPLTSGDFVHTRLTHSMEVMNIAQSLAFDFCRGKEFVDTYSSHAVQLERYISAILRTAALMHDIGNPPFGHYGEDTIQKYFIQNGAKYLRGTKEAEDMLLDFQEFDGNAQGFRVLTKLQYLGDLNGLNLTFASLGAYMKYPNINAKQKNMIGNHKHGVFYSERKIFDKVVTACSMKCEDGRIKRHPLAFLVEAADTICYRTMDLEDGLMSEKFTLDMVLDSLSTYIEKNADHGAFEDWMMDEGGHFSFEKLMKLEYQPYYPKRVVDFRVALMNYLVSHVCKTFTHNLEQIDKGEYNMELLEDDALCVEEALGNFQVDNLFKAREIISAELTGASVISGLLDIVLPKIMESSEKDDRILRLMSESGVKLIHHECGAYDPKKEEFKYHWEGIPPYYRLRMVVDWISGMTDRYALEMYQKLSGVRL